MKSFFTTLFALSVVTGVIVWRSGSESPVSPGGQGEGAQQLKVRGQLMAVALRHAADLIDTGEIKNTDDFNAFCKNAREQEDHEAFAKAQEGWWAAVTGKNWNKAALSAELRRRAPEFE